MFLIIVIYHFRAWAHNNRCFSLFLLQCDSEGEDDKVSYTFTLLVYYYYYYYRLKWIVLRCSNCSQVAHSRSGVVAEYLQVGFNASP